MRGFNYKKTVQALNYLTSVNEHGSLNKMKAIKLIWLADRLSLRKYGRTITGDEYYALPKGPVPSATRDILESNDFIDDLASDYSTAYITITDKYNYASTNQPNLKVFSKTDLEVLNTIIDQYGQLEHFELSDLSHTFPEWKKHESALDKRLSSRFPINISDFFLNIDDGKGLFIDDSETLAISKDIFEENIKLVSAF